MAALRRERWKAKLLKMGGISFLIHAALIAVFSLVPWHTIIQAQPTVYSVTLTSIALPAPEPVRPVPPPEAKPEPKPVPKPEPKPEPKPGPPRSGPTPAEPSADGTSQTQPVASG